MVLKLCISSDDALYLYKILPKISQSTLELLSGHKKLQRGNNSVKYVSKVMVLALCTLSDNTLYFMKFH